MSTILLAFGQPAGVFAGMPSISLTDLARMRVEAISFFVVVILLAAGAVQFLWNRLRRAWPVLPRLSYGRGLSLVALWGLLFVLVLTMISGARELMTPGAWEKQGFTYRLTPSPPATVAEAVTEQARRRKLEELRVSLWDYAETHDGKFPANPSATAILKERWQVPDSSGMQYLYVKGQVAGRGAAPLAYEPEIFGPMRLVLLTNGDVRQMDGDALLKALARSKP